MSIEMMMTVKALTERVTRCETDIQSLAASKFTAPQTNNSLAIEVAKLRKDLQALVQIVSTMQKDRAA